MHALMLSLVLLLADITAPVDLTGKVIGPEKQPIADATVLVYSASPKKGEAMMNPSDYPDCVKSTKTDADGAFQIAGIDESLNFRVLILASDYRPMMLNKVDPLKGQITATLKVIPKDLEADHMIKGHVVDDAGAPVVGARIEPFGCNDGTERWWGDTSKVCENETYTDTKGQFALLTKKPDIQIDLRTFGRHLAPVNNPLVSTGDADQEITLPAGASVTGRLVKDDKPLAGIRMCLCPKDRGMEHYITDYHAVTDADGKFTFANVHANDDCYLYATMKSLSPYGALSIKSCGVSADGTTADAGDLTVEPGYTVSGVIFNSDDKPVPKGAKVHLSRWETGGDSLDLTTESDGKFEFKNAPSELCEFWIQIKGYHVSDQNVSFEPANGIFLLGKVDADINDLRVQLDPDPAPARVNNSSKWQMLQNTRLTGVQAQP